METRFSKKRALLQNPVAIIFGWNFDVEIQCADITLSETVVLVYYCNPFGMEGNFNVEIQCTDVTFLKPWSVKFCFLKNIMIVLQTSCSFGCLHCVTITALLSVWRLLVGGECFFCGGIGVEGY